ncbi:MAG: thiol reductant ABC exporter subunit CydC [Actinomycetales bacterium]|nr:thiol reductant ABC exporter subunit CydC [Actinomycetales bacterium]
MTGSATVDPAAQAAPRSPRLRTRGAGGAGAGRGRGPLPAELGPNGLRTLAAVGLLAALRALALVVLAEALATSVVALATGSEAWRAALAWGAGAALVRGLGSWAVGVVAARGAAAARSAERTRLLARIAAGPRDAGTGEAAVLASSGLDALDEYFGAVIPAAVSAAVVPAVLGARILFADWVSAAILAITIPLVPLFLALIGRHTQQRADEAQGALARLSDQLVELARGLPVLVGLGRLAEQRDALAGIQSRLRARTRGTLRTAFLSALALELVATLSVAVVAVFLGIRLLDGSVTLQIALAVLVLAPECFTALRELGTAYHSAQDGLAALRRARELGEAPAADPLGAHAEGASLRVRGLTLRYPDAERPTIEDLVLDLARGETVALVAPSGGGKSTVVAALADALPAGVELQGSVEGLDPARRATVLQAPALFHDSVRAELVAAARAGFGAGRAEPGGRADAGPADAGLGDAEIAAEAMIAELGLDAVAHAHPSELSPGELRRAAVGRALLRVDAGADLLLLDEPTAHLDPANAERVRAAIRARAPRAAILLVSHESATLALADRLVLLGEPKPLGALALAGPGGRTHPTPVPTPERPARAASDPYAVAEGEPAVRRVLAALVAPARGRWLLAVMLGTLATGLGLALSAVSGWLIVRASEQPAIMYLLVAIVGVRFFGLGRSVARYAERLVAHDAVFAALDALRLRLWGRLAARGAAERRLLAPGAAVELLVTRLDQLRDLAPRVLTPLASGALSVLGIAIAIALIAPPAAGVTLVALALGAIGAPIAARLAASAAHHVRGDAQAELARRIAGLEAAAAELRGSGLTAGALGELGEVDARLVRADRRAAWAAGLGGALVALATGAGAVAVPAAIAASGSAAGVGAAAAAAAALLLLASADPLVAIVTAALRLPALRSAARALAPLVRPEAPSERGGLSAPTRMVELELDRLALRWPGAADLAVPPVSARVRAGEWLVVTGPSGSGKSTLLTHLLGGLEAESGRTRVNGRDAREIHLDSWRRRVAWCPQEAHVFDSTLRGNLLIGRRRARAGDAPVSDGDLEDVLRRVGLGRVLERSAAGLDTRVGPRGSALSGGERQRLAVARALLADAQILLLDEPTAHLDAPSARALLDDLRAATADRIVVLVTHRDDDPRPDDPRLDLGVATRAADAGEHGADRIATSGDAGARPRREAPVAAGAGAAMR